LDVKVKARGGRVFIITDNPKLALNIDPDPLVIPQNGPLTALIAVLPLQVLTNEYHRCCGLLRAIRPQLIAYELAVLKGINPDTPRNLAKAVTTD